MSKYVNFGNVGVFGNNGGIKNVKIDASDVRKVKCEDGKLFMDGRLYEDENLKDKEIVSIIIEGNVTFVNSNVDVEVHGDVSGSVRAMRDVDIKGSVVGNIDAGRDVEIGKDVVNGSVDAGRDVEVGGHCKNITELKY